MRSVRARAAWVVGASVTAVLVVVLVFMWRDSRPPAMSFDSQVWLNCRYEAGGFRRFGMLRDLVDNHLQPGADLESVRRLLGEPESVRGERGDGSWVYYVRYRAGVVGHRYPDIGCFVIDFHGSSVTGVDFVRTLLAVPRTRIPF